MDWIVWIVWISEEEGGREGDVRSIVYRVKEIREVKLSIYVLRAMFLLVDNDWRNRRGAKYLVP